MVRWFARRLVKSEERWTAKEESNTRDCGIVDGMGHECAPAGFTPEHDGAQCIRLHIDGGGSDENRGDCIRSQGPQLHFVQTRRRDQQFPISPTIRE